MQIYIIPNFIWQDVENFVYSQPRDYSSAKTGRDEKLSENIPKNSYTNTMTSSTPAAPNNQSINASSSSARRQLMSRAAVTHKFRKLKTPSKCRECDSYVYFQGQCKCNSLTNSMFQKRVGYVTFQTSFILRSFLMLQVTSVTIVDYLLTKNVQKHQLFNAVTNDSQEE